MVLILSSSLDQTQRLEIAYVRLGLQNNERSNLKARHVVVFEVEHVLFSRHFQNFQNIATPRDLKSYKSLQVPDHRPFSV